MFYFSTLSLSLYTIRTLNNRNNKQNILIFRTIGMYFFNRQLDQITTGRIHAIAADAFHSKKTVQRQSY